MAHLKGIIQFTGRVGTIIFYKSPHGVLARSVGSLDKKRIATDPAFRRTRDTGTEFSRVSSAGRMLRREVRMHLPQASMHSTNYRLNAALVAALQGEKVHGHGARLLSCADLGALRGYEWNDHCRFRSAFRKSVDVYLDRASGIFKAHTGACNGKTMLKPPKGATHGQMVLLGLAPDFDGNTCTADAAEGPLWEVKGPIASLELVCHLPPASVLPLIGGIGMRFFNQVNGVLYPLKHGDAFVVEAVDGAG